MTSSVLFRARVPSDRLKRAEKVFARLGMKTSDAFNIFLAQVELRKDMPFSITANPEPLLTTAEQGKAWEAALAWINSGQKISEYALKHGKTMPAPDAKKKPDQAILKGDVYVPEGKTEPKEEIKKATPEPAVTSKVKIDIEINLIINGKRISL